MIIKYFIFLTVVFLLSFSNIVLADNLELTSLGMSANKNWILFYAPKSIEKGTSDNVRVQVKLELSEDGKRAFRKSFDASAKEAEDKSGTKVEDKDELFEILVKAEAQSYEYIFYCKEMEYKRTTAGGGAFMQVFKIKDNSAEKRLYDILCKDSHKDNPKK